MDFFVEILLCCAIICLIVFIVRLNALSNERIKKLKDDSEFQLVKLSQRESEYVELKSNFEKQTKDYSLKESQLHKNLTGLREVLSSEQESVKKREAELKNKEEELTKALEQVQKNLEEETENRKKVLSQKKSSEVRLGHIAEKLAPFLDEFDFDPENCIFLGQPIDYISFDDELITVIEIKTGKSQLNPKQRHIRDLIKAKQVAWKEIRIK